MGRKGAFRNGAGKAAAGQSQSGKKPSTRGPFTLRNFAIAGLAVVCGLFFLLHGRPNTNQRGTRAADESPDHAELGRLASSRRIAVRRST